LQRVFVGPRPYPQAGERKIISHRIIGGDRSKRAGYILDRFHISLPSRGEAEGASDPVHMGIEGDQELGRRHPLPSSRIHVIPSYHPANIQVHPLASAPLAGRRQECIASPPVRHGELAHKGCKCGEHGFMLIPKPGAKTCMEGAIPVNGHFCSIQKRCEILAGGEAMSEIRPCCTEHCAGCVHEKMKGLRHPSEHQGDAPEYLFNPAICKGGCHEPHDLPVRQIRIGVEELEGIRMHVFAPVESHV